MIVVDEGLMGVTGRECDVYQLKTILLRQQKNMNKIRYGRGLGGWDGDGERKGRYFYAQTSTDHSMRPPLRKRVLRRRRGLWLRWSFLLGGGACIANKQTVL